jgi:mono/diheme cytochrome c family protein
MKPTRNTLAAGLTALLATHCAHGADAPDDKVARGKYIVSTSACHDCHTPWKVGPNGPEPDMSRALSGHPEDMLMPPAPALTAPWMMAAAGTNTAWAGPWGVSFTANLTPDPETGTGKWSLRNFKDTIRTGRHFGRGRAILPPMPWPVYRNLTDTDLEAVFAYLQSVPPIRNRVPQPLPPAAAAASAP